MDLDDSDLKGSTPVLTNTFTYANSYIQTNYELIGGYDGDADDAYHEYGGDAFVHSALVKFKVPSGTVTVRAELSQDGDVRLKDGSKSVFVSFDCDQVLSYIVAVCKIFGEKAVFQHLENLIGDEEPTEVKFF